MQRIDIHNVPWIFNEYIQEAETSLSTPPEGNTHNTVWRIVIPIQDNNVPSMLESRTIPWTSGKTFREVLQICRELSIQLYPVLDPHWSGSDDANSKKDFHHKDPNFDEINTMSCLQSLMTLKNKYNIKFWAVGYGHEMEYMPTIPKEDSTRMFYYDQYFSNFKTVYEKLRDKLPGIPLVVGGLSGFTREQGILQLGPYILNHRDISGMNNVYFAIHGNFKTDAWLRNGINNLHELIGNLTGFLKDFGVVVDEDANHPEFLNRVGSSTARRIELCERLGVKGYGAFNVWNHPNWGSFKGLEKLGVFFQGQVNQVNLEEWIPGQQTIPDDEEETDIKFKPSKRLMKLAENAFGDSVDFEKEYKLYVKRLYKEFEKAIKFMYRENANKANEHMPPPEADIPIMPSSKYDTMLLKEWAARMEAIRRVASRCDNNGIWKADYFDDQGEETHSKFNFKNPLELLEFLEVVVLRRF